MLQIRENSRLNRKLNFLKILLTKNWCTGPFFRYCYHQGSRNSFCLYIFYLVSCYLGGKFDTYEKNERYSGWEIEKVLVRSPFSYFTLYQYLFNFLSCINYLWWMKNSRPRQDQREINNLNEHHRSRWISKAALMREQTRLHLQITLKELVSDVLMFGFFSILAIM